MNKIPKYKSKNNISKAYIKVTKKDQIEKNKLNISKKISQKKLKFSKKDSNRKFGNENSSKVKNSISPDIVHRSKNRKSLSNIEEKVNNISNIYFLIQVLFNFKIHPSSSQIPQKKNRKVIGIGNSNDKKLYVNKSGAMMLIKKTENPKNNENLITTTLSNQNIFKKNNNSKNNNGNICSSFRSSNGIGSKLQNTISFGNNIMSKTNMSVLYTKKSDNKKDNISNFCINNVLTSSNISLL